MFEPEIVLAASPREWSQRLHRHVVDHGGARVRATVLDPREALRERCDVFLVDDTTSFLSRHLVDELHCGGRRVLGVYDPDDERGKGDLTDLGVDAVLARTAPPAAFVEAIASLTASSRGADDAAFDRLVAQLDERGARPGQTPDAPTADGRLLVVGGPPGGTGATEVTVALGAAAARRGLRAVLVDADDCAPSLAQRLALPLWPNLRTAVDAVAHAEGRLQEALTVAPRAGVAVLAGLSSPRDWADVRPAEVLAVLDRLLDLGVSVAANVGAVLEALPAQGPQRYGLTRAVVGRADVIVAVGTATPVGVARLLSWSADAAELAPAATLQPLVNRAPVSAFKRDEIADELGRVAGLSPPLFVPEDRRVEAAAWAGEPVADGPFTRAVERLAAALLPAPQRRRRWSGPAARLTGRR